MRQTTYHPGGAKAGPAGNRAEELDSVAGTYTRWDANGNQLEQRALTASEIASLAAQESSATGLQNRTQLISKATQALTANATYLGIGTPTAAQNAAQVKSLTRQVNALLRIELQELSDVSDT